MSEDFLAILGEKFRTVRRFKNLDQQELAERVGVTRQHICSIEKGRSPASIALLVQIANELGCELIITLKLKEVAK